MRSARARERRCSLTPITLPLISPPRPLSSLLLRCSPVTVPAAAHGGAGAVKNQSAASSFRTSSRRSGSGPAQGKMAECGRVKIYERACACFFQTSRLACREEGFPFFCVCVSEVVGVRGMVDGWVGPWLHLDSGKQPDQPLSARAALQSISGPCSCPEQAV